MKFILPLLALSTVLLAEAAAEVATEPIGAITELQGSVTLTHATAQAAPVSAKLQDDVLFQDVIETAEESRTQALFKNETLVSLGEKSRVEITEFIYDPTESKLSMLLRLTQGRARALVGTLFQGLGSRFEVHTPTSVVAARGTYFVVCVGSCSA